MPFQFVLTCDPHEEPVTSSNDRQQAYSATALILLSSAPLNKDVVRNRVPGVMNAGEEQQ